MKRYGVIVTRQFAVNKKRNISTILGIILSIILFTTVGYLHDYKNKIHINEALYVNGNYEAGFRDITYKEVDVLRNNIYIEDLSLFRQDKVDTIKIDDIEKYIYVYEVDENGLKNTFKNRIEIEEGRYPEDSTEVIIDNVSMQNLNKQIGDKVTVDDNTYTIVGIYDKNFNRDTYSIGLISAIDSIEGNENINAIFNIDKKKDKMKIVYKIAIDLGLSPNLHGEFNSLIVNNQLLYQYGEDANGVNGSELKVMEYSLYGIILILTSLLTYVAINVSIKERMEQFSILRCIGATSSKIRMLLIKESFLLTILSLVPGIILGQIVCYFISDILIRKIAGINILEVGYTFQVSLVVKVIILTMINIIFSTIIPIIKIGKISPIEGVATSGIKQSKIKKRDSKIIRKLFGYDGELAYKNIRSNNRNFITNILITIIITTTFIVFIGYKNNMIDAYNHELEISKDIIIDVNNNVILDINSGEEQYVDIYENIKKYKGELYDLNVVESIFTRVIYQTSGIFEDVTLNKWVDENVIEIQGKEAVYDDEVYIIVMADEALEELIMLQDLDLTVDEFNDNGVIISERNILKNYIVPKREQIFNINKGEEFSLNIGGNQYLNYNEYNKENIEEFNEFTEKVNLKYLGSFDSNDIFGGNRYGFQYVTTLVISESFYSNNKEKFENANPISGSLLIDLNKEISKEEASKIIDNYANKNELYYFDNEESTKQIKNSVSLVTSIIYILVFLIMIVVAVNIINNKYMSIKLRGKEIGTMLALGVSKKRLKKILILEAIVQWLIASVISIILIAIGFKIIREVLVFNFNLESFKIPVLESILCILIIFLINVIGVYLPIRKIRYTDTTELIRNEE